MLFFGLHLFLISHHTTISMVHRVWITWNFNFRCFMTILSFNIFNAYPTRQLLCCFLLNCSWILFLFQMSNHRFCYLTNPLSYMIYIAILLYKTSFLRLFRHIMNASLRANVQSRLFFIWVLSKEIWKTCILTSCLLYFWFKFKAWTFKVGKTIRFRHL